jgi:hypothetical protein
VELSEVVVSFGWERLLLKVDLSAVNIVFRDLTIHDYAISSISFFSSSQSPLLNLLLLLLLLSLLFRSPAAAFTWLGAIATYALKDCVERRRPASRKLRTGVQVGCFLHLFIVSQNEEVSGWKPLVGLFLLHPVPLNSNHRALKEKSLFSQVISTQYFQLSPLNSLTHSLPHLLTPSLTYSL